jgi:predicted transcriptional regulator
MPKSIIEMASEIVAAQAGYAPMAADEISEGVKRIVEVLQELHTLEVSFTADGGAASVPKLSPQDSIQRNRVICLECHRDFKLLSNRHLSQHGLTSRDYKLKYGLPLRQALSAKVLTQTRRKIAKEKGLGAKLVAHRRQQK